MRNITLLSVLVIGLSAGGAMAQQHTSDTQTPPAPNAGAQAVESANSLPRSAITGNQVQPGSDVATTRVAPAR